MTAIIIPTDETSLILDVVESITVKSASPLVQLQLSVTQPFPSSGVDPTPPSPCPDPRPEQGMLYPRGEGSIE